MDPPKEKENETPLVVKKAKLKTLMSDDQWNSLIEKQGTPAVWTEEQVDRWTKKLEDKNA